MDSTNDIQRGSCSNKTGLKQCSRCKKMPYCSIECQKADWRGHKKICRYTASSSVQVRQPDNVLSELRQMNDHPLCSPGEAEETMTATLKVFNTAEIRMAVFSYLPAAVLLHSQRVCRSWYRTIALEKILQQRLFMEYGPGKLIQAAYKGEEVLHGIQPRTDRQVGHSKTVKRSFGSPTYLVQNTSTGAVEDKSVLQLKNVILNPFFTKLWPQDPTNMTYNPYITVAADNNSASWRRMQLTSPPMKQLDMNLWYSKNGQGNQMCPSTGPVSTGVTLGHLSDLLASLPKKLKLHWMQVHGDVWWARSADAVVLPKEREISDDDPVKGL